MLSDLNLVYRLNAPPLMANKIPNQNIHSKFKWWSSYSISKAFSYKYWNSQWRPHDVTFAVLNYSLTIIKEKLFYLGYINWTWNGRGWVINLHIQTKTKKKLYVRYLNTKYQNYNEIFFFILTWLVNICWVIYEQSVQDCLLRLNKTKGHNCYCNQSRKDFETLVPLFYRTQ